jgi:hypothetical protein
LEDKDNKPFEQEFSNNWLSLAMQITEAVSQLSA